MLKNVGECHLSQSEITFAKALVKVALAVNFAIGKLSES